MFHIKCSLFHILYSEVNYRMGSFHIKVLADLQSALFQIPRNNIFHKGMFGCTTHIHIIQSLTEFPQMLQLKLSVQSFPA